MLSKTKMPFECNIGFPGYAALSFIVLIFLLGQPKCPWHYMSNLNWPVDEGLGNCVLFVVVSGTKLGKSFGRQFDDTIKVFTLYNRQLHL